MEMNDGYDNDCDGLIDEELDNGVDDDRDGQVDEDLGWYTTLPGSSSVTPTLPATGGTTQSGQGAGQQGGQGTVSGQGTWEVHTSVGVDGEGAVTTAPVVGEINRGEGTTGDGLVGRGTTGVDRPGEVGVGGPGDGDNTDTDRPVSSQTEASSSHGNNQGSDTVSELPQSVDSQEPGDKSNTDNGYTSNSVTTAVKITDELNTQDTTELQDGSPDGGRVTVNPGGGVSGDTLSTPSSGSKHTTSDKDTTAKTTVNYKEGDARTNSGSGMTSSWINVDTDHTGGESSHHGNLESDITTPNSGVNNADGHSTKDAEGGCSGSPECIDIVEGQSSSHHTGSTAVSSIGGNGGDGGEGDGQDTTVHVNDGDGSQFTTTDVPHNQTYDVDGRDTSRDVSTDDSSTDTTLPSSGNPSPVSNDRPSGNPASSIPRVTKQPSEPDGGNKGDPHTTALPTERPMEQRFVMAIIISACILAGIPTLWFCYVFCGPACSACCAKRKSKAAVGSAPGSQTAILPVPEKPQEESPPPRPKTLTFTSFAPDVKVSMMDKASKPNGEETPSKKRKKKKKIEEKEINKKPISKRRRSRAVGVIEEPEAAVPVTSEQIPDNNTQQTILAMPGNSMPSKSNKASRR